MLSWQRTASHSGARRRPEQGCIIPAPAHPEALMKGLGSGQFVLSAGALLCGAAA